MKIEELANLGAAAAYAGREKSDSHISLNSESSFWEADRPAREAFAAAVRDAVLAEQPAADVPTWRPIAEFPERPHDDDDEYVYWDDDGTWHGDFMDKQGATHFILPPPPPQKPDPFEAWWEKHKDSRVDQSDARIIWNAAREAKQ